MTNKELAKDKDDILRYLNDNSNNSIRSKISDISNILEINDSECYDYLKDIEISC